MDPGLGNSLAVSNFFLGPECIGKQFTFPYHRFLLKGAIITSDFFSPLLGRGEQQEAEELEEKKHLG